MSLGRQNNEKGMKVSWTRRCPEGWIINTDSMTKVYQRGPWKTAERLLRDTADRPPERPPRDFKKIEWKIHEFQTHKHTHRHTQAELLFRKPLKYRTFSKC